MELKKMEIYTKALNVAVMTRNNINNETIDYLIAEIDVMKDRATKLKEEMEDLKI